MTVQMWGIHNDRLSHELISEGFISIGWDDVSSLASIPNDREAIKRILSVADPESKPRSISSQAGVIYRFAHVIAAQDIVVAPDKSTSTINIGVVTGDYYYDASASSHKHRRPVQWRKINVPRAVFSQAALYTLGSMLTLFQINRNTDEFLTVLNSTTDDADEIAETIDILRAPLENNDPEDEQEPEQPRATTIMRYTRDFILEVLSSRISPREFEELSAALLRAIGYQARVTQYFQDGGIDVIAHKDPLGIEPPQIKVQCKQKMSTIGSPEVNQLIGTLSNGELCLFFTLGGYSTAARSIERLQSGLRLLTGEDIVDLIIDNYDNLSEHWKRIIPLSPVLVVADETK
ncbi:restriction endonuclease [Corynebacterium crudilactis]|uniref:Restriction endonuclease n=1 Tax=Corynebacterium crudilactis TaxID=1652495 RepID=A0A172QR18_9CORY|nr:restriction endonuclease [Corynebacterium crudilactis]ANE03100.1 restriction endonuclease [Corynebacterium crudilactis]